MTQFFVTPLSDKGISFVQGLLGDRYELHEYPDCKGVNHNVANIAKPQIRMLLKHRSDLKNGRDFALCASVRGEPLKWFRVRDSQRLSLTQLVRRANGKKL